MNAFPTIQENEIAGGNILFQFAPYTTVTSVPDAVNGRVTSAIVMVGANTFLDGYASQGSLIIEEQQDESDAGPYWQVGVKGFYPKNDDDILSLFQEMASCRFILLVKDTNGFYRIAGNTEEPLKFRYKMVSGSRAADRPGMDFEFTGICTKPSPIYDYGDYSMPGS